MAKISVKKMDSRLVAYQILLKLQQQSSNSSLLLQDALKNEPDVRNRNLITDLVLGTTRWRGRLLYLIDAFSKTPVHRLDEEVLVILQMGVYQLLFAKIESHAAINETVNLTRKAKRTSASSLVNAVLRKIQKNSDHLPEPQSADATVKLSVRWSHPEWLVKRWLARFGEAETERLLKWNMQIPSLYIRINPLVSSIEGALEHLSSEEIQVAQTEFGAAVFRVLKGAPQFTQAFANGEFYIQDPAVEKLVNYIDPKVGAKILEIAAAPGGKTVQMAGRIKNQGMIVSVDSDLRRMKLWRSNMERMEIRSAFGIVTDASRPLPLSTTFDQVVIDAPCSSVGVIRRHPEVKWWRKEEELFKFAEAQLQILEACAKYVRDYGEIVYIVCSFEPEETVQVVDRFLTANPAFRKIQESFLLPHQEKTDGFFLAKLKKFS